MLYNYIESFILKEKALSFIKLKDPEFLFSSIFSLILCWILELKSPSNSVWTFHFELELRRAYFNTVNKNAKFTPIVV